MTDVVVVPPGQARLFAVEPTAGTRLTVITVTGTVVVTTTDLAAAVIAAATVDGGGWVVAADRWSAHITNAFDSWQVVGDGHAPVAAIRRVLALIPMREEP